jgi:hypothetical protein
MRPIGLLGASGAVGRAVLHHLRQAGAGPLRLGARRDAALRDAACPGEAVMPLDIADDTALRRFCEGCAVVVNAAGPTRVVMDRAARAALAAGADYVDAAGDDAVHDRLSGTVAGGHRLLLSAGIMPGLTTLLPRHLAAGLVGPLRLQAHAGGLDRFTPAAAGDYVASFRNGYGTPLAAWRDGRVVPRALSAAHDAELPFFPAAACAFPYLSTENERLARRLGLAEGAWFNVFEGRQLRDAFARLQQLADQGREDTAAAALCHAAALDLAGREPYQILAFILRGRSVTRSLVLRTPDGYALTGAMAAFAALEVRDRAVPPGLHFTGDVLDTGRTLDRLRASPAVTALEILETPPAEAAFEEGAL